MKCTAWTLYLVSSFFHAPLQVRLPEVPHTAQHTGVTRGPDADWHRQGTRHHHCGASSVRFGYCAGRRTRAAEQTLAAFESLPSVKLIIILI